MTESRKNAALFAASVALVSLGAVSLLWSARTPATQPLPAGIGLVMVIGGTALALSRCIKKVCRRSALLTLLSVVIGVMAVATTWSELPCKLAFRISEQDLELAYSQAIKDPTAFRDQWAGVFYIRPWAEDGDAKLWRLDGTGLWHDHGFARTPVGGNPPKTASGFVVFYRPIGNGWYHWLVFRG